MAHPSIKDVLERRKSLMYYDSTDSRGGLTYGKGLEDRIWMVIKEGGVEVQQLPWRESEVKGSVAGH